MSYKRIEVEGPHLTVVPSVEASLRGELGRQDNVLSPLYVVGELQTNGVVSALPDGFVLTPKMRKIVDDPRFGGQDIRSIVVGVFNDPALSVREIGDLFGISRTTMTKWRKLFDIAPLGTIESPTEAFEERRQAGIAHAQKEEVKALRVKKPKKKSEARAKATAEQHAKDPSISERLVAHNRQKFEARIHAVLGDDPSRSLQELLATNDLVDIATMCNVSPSTVGNWARVLNVTVPPHCKKATSKPRGREEYLVILALAEGNNIISQLPAEYQDVIKHRYPNGRVESMEDVGRVLGLSRQGVEQREKRAFNMLRKLLNID